MEEHSCVGNEMARQYADQLPSMCVAYPGTSETPVAAGQSEETSTSPAIGQLSVANSVGGGAVSGTYR